MVALKTIEIQGSSIRCLVKGVEISLDSLSSMFQSLKDLQQIFWNFENLKLCPGVVNPLLLKIVGTAKIWNQEEKLLAFEWLPSFIEQRHVY